MQHSPAPRREPAVQNVPMWQPRVSQLISKVPVPAAQDFRDQYKGFTNHRGSQVDVEDYSSLSPEGMWRNYISNRVPLKISGLINDEGWDGDKWRDVEYLRAIAGDTEVKVEPIDQTLGQFGSSAKRSKVLLKDFLSSLSDQYDAGNWYMTTQYLDSDDEEEDPSDGDDAPQQKHTRRDLKSDCTDSDSRPTTPALSSSSSPGQSSHSSEDSDHVSVTEDALIDVDLDFSLPPPTDALSPFFPLPTPALMGGLVLQQCNLWLGNGVTGKSSGLHHDFHDNLYLLLSGRKRFLIWPPSAHRWLEPHGQIRRVHPNGLIEYAVRGQPPLRSDGLTDREYLQWLIRARQRATLEADERAAKDTGEGRQVKALRKGKGRQTQEQAETMALLQVAETGLALMDANRCEGFDDFDESDESDESGMSSAASDLVVSDAEFDDDQFGGDNNDASDASEEQPTSWSGNVSEDSSSEEGDVDEKGGLTASPARKRNRVRNAESESLETTPVKGEKDVLRIPPGGLPGGFRGTLHDLDNVEGDSDEEEYGSDGALDLPLGVTSGDDDDIEAEAEAELAELQARAAIISRSRTSLRTGDFFDPNTEPMLEVASPSSDGQGPISLVQELGSGDGVSDEDESGSDFFLQGSDEGSKPRQIMAHRPIALADGDKVTDDESDEGSVSLADTDYEDEGEGEDMIRELERRAEANLRAERGQPVWGLAQHDHDESKEAAPPSFSAIRPQVMHWVFGIHDNPAMRGERRDQRIPGCQPHDRILLPRRGCPAPMEIHLQPGEMLYLPAGWFHEVTSYCDPLNAQSGSDANVHMALNYWFHPPTAIKRRVQVRPTAAAQEAARTSSRSAEAEDKPQHMTPYEDEEVWGEIRKTVKARVDKIRSRAAAQFLAAQRRHYEKTGKASNGATHADEALQRLAQRYLRSSLQHTAEHSTESSTSGKRKRGE